MIILLPIKYEIYDEADNFLGSLEYEGEGCYKVKIEAFLSVPELEEILEEIKKVFKKEEGGQDGK